MKGMFLRRGQNLADLALIIGVVGLVFIGMEVYIKRSVQGKVKDLTDYIVSNTQSAMQPDQAGETSNSIYTLDSSMASIESEGGKRGLSGTENSFYEYETKSNNLTNLTN